MPLTPLPVTRGVTLPPKGACGCCEWEHTVGDTKLYIVFERDHADGCEASITELLCSSCVAESNEKGVLFPIRDNWPIAGECEWFVEGLA